MNDIQANRPTPYKGQLSASPLLISLLEGKNEEKKFFP